MATLQEADLSVPQPIDLHLRKKVGNPDRPKRVLFRYWDAMQVPKGRNGAAVRLCGQKPGAQGLWHHALSTLAGGASPTQAASGAPRRKTTPKIPWWLSWARDPISGSLIRS